ncbi:MAG: hypothetical protein EKK46_05805 [Rhodocyclaceae bacterium]|nr:MAG: hypothetical protein EKK46_05805 [Rhodocyclaceae bacterium]
MRSWEDIRQQLLREAREYFADLREILDSLKRVEGWLTLILLIVTFFVVIYWFITGMGFDTRNSLSGTLGSMRQCSPISDRNALFIALDGVCMMLFALFALGEMVALLMRIKQGRPAQPRTVAALSAMMLVTGVAGIIYMKSIC